MTTTLGRPVLAARLAKETKFDVTKRSIQTNLLSRDAALQQKTR